nr:MAG TPA: hypothetical protein [Caudoviricetes sp.]DAM76514.1 MAG TPA: hypothetical protein [Caudoviricetes sp.]
MQRITDYTCSVYLNSIINFKIYFIEDGKT